MDMGRPRGTDNRSLTGPPILYEGPGRTDKFKADHCDSCSVPLGSEKLLTFELRLHGRPAGHWTLCQRCWEWRQEGPRAYDPDPLTLPESGGDVAA